MVEYIERERLKEAFNADLQTLQTVDEHTMNLILMDIDEAPAADVAPVVRCRECIHRDGTPGQPNILCFQMKDDDFCSYGDRR